MGEMVLQNSLKEQKKSAKNSFSESWRLSQREVDLETGLPFGKEVSASEREAPAVGLGVVVRLPSAG